MVATRSCRDVNRLELEAVVASVPEEHRVAVKGVKARVRRRKIRDGGARGVLF